MKIRPNYKIATTIGVIHFILGIASLFVGVSHAVSSSSTGNSGLFFTYIFTFPLTTIFELAHNREGFGFPLNLFAMIIQSFSWGVLISLFFDSQNE
jgi:hypothetical protein